MAKYADTKKATGAATVDPRTRIARLTAANSGALSVTPILGVYVSDLRENCQPLAV